MGAGTLLRFLVFWERCVKVNFFLLCFETNYWLSILQTAQNLKQASTPIASLLNAHRYGYSLARKLENGGWKWPWTPMGKPWHAATRLACLAVTMGVLYIRASLRNILYYPVTGYLLWPHTFDRCVRVSRQKLNLKTRAWAIRNLEKLQCCLGFMLHEQRSQLSRNIGGRWYSKNVYAHIIYACNLTLACTHTQTHTDTHTDSPWPEAVVAVVTTVAVGGGYWTRLT